MRNLLSFGRYRKRLIFTSILSLLAAFFFMACSRAPAINKPAPPVASHPSAAHSEAIPVPAAPAPAPTKAMLEKQQKSRDMEALNEQLLAKAQFQSDPGDVVLGSGDLVNIEIFEAKELNTKARISSRGFVTLPLLGELKVDGLTAREAETRIEGLYKEKYIKDPHVSVFVEEHLSQRVTLVGEIKNPDTYDLVGNQDLLDVLALGGGMTDKAGRMVQVRRRGIIAPKEGESAKAGVIYIDMEKLVREGTTELNIKICGGDVIYVPEAGEIFVDGAVRKRGSYPLRQKMTLQEAIVAAGGMAPYADNEVTVIRTEDGEPKVHTFDVSKLENWGFQVKDQDIITVDSDGLKKVWYGFRFSLFGVGYEDPED